MKDFALVFPGQGSQSVGMLQDFMGNEIVSKTFSEANEALGYDLLKLIQEGPESELNKTEITQPAILAASIAAFRAFAAHNLAAKAYAGHSLGEYSALVAAGALDFADALRLVRLRGQAMQEAVPQGTGSMAAVLGLDDDVIVECCQQASQGDDAVWAANFNSPGQVVVSGAKNAVARVGELLKEKGAKKVVELSVSAPSHCPLMQKAADRLQEELAKIEVKDIATAVYCNAFAQAITKKDEIIKALVLQLTAPVKYTQTIAQMQQDGIKTFIEVGPGKVLSGLNKRIERSLELANIANQEGLDKALELINN